MEFIEVLSLILGIVFACAYLYQIVYFLVGILAEVRERIGATRKSLPDAEHGTQSNRYAFVIAARNEANVIPELIESLQRQTYPAELFDIFVIADNCKDDTAEVARIAGAYVYERTNTEKMRKGYALSELFDHIRDDFGGYRAYDGYIIFDADNIVDKNFLREMDKKFVRGHRVVTSYRNSKNYGASWITSGYSIAFMREAQFLNRPRRILNSSATVSGTGYLISSEILEEKGGWHYHLLTEDYAFTTELIIDGEKIAYTEKAFFYDEQPTGFKQSWTQRVRWTRGFYQVLFKYGKPLLKCMFKDKSMVLSRYDIFMFLAPSFLFNLVTAALSVLAIVLNIVDAQSANAMAPDVGLSFLSGLLGFYALNFVQGLITVASEWKEIKATTGRKIASIFTYPLFMFTYIPISLVALIVRPTWNPIAHNTVGSLEDYNNEGVQTLHDASSVNVTPPKDREMDMTYKNMDFD